MNTKKVITIFIITIYFSLCSFLFCQEKFGKFNTSWSNVIPGEVITEPVVTSYGFCVVTDGRSLSAFSNDGKLLWEKPTYSSKNVKISCLNEDFIVLYDKRKDSLKLFNPSGTILWDKKLDYELTSMPFSGRDGRFFVTGETVLECYNINGICKWSVATPPQKRIGLKELPDGSLIVFLNEVEGKTTAIRISPFGKLLENITFSGEVINAYTLPQGVFLTFSDNSSGLFSLANGLSQNKWVLGVKPKNSYLIADCKNYLFLELYNTKVRVNKINPADGTIKEQFDINNINGNDLQLAKLNDTGLFIADSENCYIINLDGSVNYVAGMLDDKGSTKWNYVIYTRDNHIVFCLENWTINAYLTSQMRYTNKYRPKASYNEYYDINSASYMFPFIETIDRNIISESRIQTLQHGFYGEDEIIYASDIYSLCNAYLELTSRKFSSKNLNVFDKDAYGTETAFKMLPLLGTIESSNYIARLISTTDNKSYLNVLINSAVICGYDPDGKILKEIELTFSKLTHKDSKLLKTICDAVYSICYFMGRPAYNIRGKSIIQKMFLPQFDLETRDYAKKTLIKIAQIENDL